MRTRVHNNAGAACVLKETMQLNFDPDDEEPLLLFVKNQKVMGASELGRLTLEASSGAKNEISDMIRDSKSRARSRGIPEWDENNFQPKKLMPRGKIWLRVSAVDGQDDV